MQIYYFSIAILFVAMASIQIGASLAKQLFPIVGAIGTTTLRLCLAAIILSAINRPWRGKVKQKDLFFIILYGTSLGLMNLCFYLSLARIPLGIAVALEFTGPLILALYYSRQITDFIWVFLAMVGILLILPLSETVQALDFEGIFLALGAGLFWALYIVFGQRTGSSMTSGKIATLGIIVAAIVVLPVSIFLVDFNAVTFEIIPLSIAMAVFSSALPYSMEMIALKKLPAKTFGILMSVEPALAALAGFIFLHEHLTWVQVSAIGLIIIACYGTASSKKHNSPAEILE